MNPHNPLEILHCNTITNPNREKSIRSLNKQNKHKGKSLACQVQEGSTIRTMRVLNTTRREEQPSHWAAPLIVFLPMYSVVLARASRPLHFLLMCSKTVAPYVSSQGEQLVVWLRNWKMNIVRHVFFFLFSPKHGTACRVMWLSN